MINIITIHKQCIGINLLMISIVVQCIEIAKLMRGIVLQCIGIVLLMIALLCNTIELYKECIRKKFVISIRCATKHISNALQLNC